METSSTTPKSYQRLRNEHALLWFADGREGIPLKAVSCSEVLLKLVQQNSTACIPDLSRTQVRMWSMQAAQSGCLTSVEELVEAIKVADYLADSSSLHNTATTLNERLLSGTEPEETIVKVLNDLTEDQALTVLRAHDSSSSTALQQLLSKLPESQHRLALLAHAPSLESHHCLNLPISYPPITAQAMHAAVFFTALQSLHVCPWLSPQELHSTLRSIEALPNLTCLDLSGTHHISKEACTALSQTICKLTKLQVLRCDQCGLTTAACLALFPALSALHELRSLSLGRHIKGIEGDQGVTIITPTCARVLSAQFRHITKLTSLCLVGVKLNNEAAEVITRKLHKLPQLCVIDLRGAHASMDGFWSFQKACWACTTPPAQLELLLNQVFSITQVPKPNDSIPCVRSISYQLDASGSSHLHNPQSISAPSMPLPHVTKLVLQVLCMRHEGLPLANMLSNLPNLAHLDILLGDVGAGVPHIKGKEVVPLIAPIAALTYLTFLSWDHDNYGRSCRYARRFAPVLASLPFLQHLHLEIRGFYDPERADQAQRAQHKTVTEDPLVGCFASLAQLTHLTIAFCNGYLLASLGPVLPCMHRLKRLKLEDSSFYSTEPQRPYAEGLHAVATYATALSNLESLVLRLAAQNPEIEGVTSIIDALHKSSALTQLVVCAKSRTRGSRSESHQVALQLARSIGTLPLLQHLSCAVDCWCDGLTGALLPSKHYCLTRLEFRVPLDCDSTPMQYQTRRKAEVPSGQVIARSLCCAPQLAVLIVDACEITEADLQPLNALSLLPNLTTFSIRYFRISKAAASALGYALEGLNLPELATVRIELDEKPNVYPHSELRCETLQRIVQKLPKLPSLRNLSLGAIDGEHMIQQSPEIMAAAGQFGASLAAVISTTFRLQVLDLSSVYVRPECIQHLAPCLAQQLGLTRLKFALGSIQATGAQALAKHMHAHPALAKQELIFQTMDSQCMAALAEWYKSLPDLESIHYRHIQFVSENARAQFNSLQLNLAPTCRVVVQ